MYILKLVDSKNTITEEIVNSFGEGVIKGTEIANKHQHQVFIVSSGIDTNDFKLKRILPNTQKQQ